MTLQRSDMSIVRQCLTLTLTQNLSVTLNSQTMSNTKPNPNTDPKTIATLDCWLSDYQYVRI